jgi:sarcosine oxidase subunit alpha
MSKPLQGRLPRGTRGSKIRFKLDGNPCYAYEGETIAAVMTAEGKQTFRLSPKDREPRGLYCGMGICFECLVTVDGILNVQACQTLVKEGMTVETGIPPMEGSEGNGR